MSWKSWEESAEKGPVGFGLKAFFAFLFIAVVIVISVGVVSFALNPVKQAGRIVNKTIDADNVIYNYEWFKKQWRAVKAIDSKINVSALAYKSFKKDAGPRKEWTFEDKTESSRLRSITLGLQQQRADMVADYNAKANMMNRKMFMGNDCPEHIE